MGWGEPFSDTKITPTVSKGLLFSTLFLMWGATQVLLSLPQNYLQGGFKQVMPGSKVKLLGWL